MYNKEYAWFDKLNDKERKLFLNFLIGYLNVTPKKLRKIYDEFNKTSVIEYDASVSREYVGSS